MRVIIQKRSSTKPERIFYEILKKNHIHFKYHVLVDDREIDFIVGNYAIEIDGHEQSSQRNAWLLSKGYQLIHYRNSALLKNRSVVEEDITSKYGLFSKSVAGGSGGKSI